MNDQHKAEIQRFLENEVLQEAIFKVLRAKKEKMLKEAANIPASNEQLGENVKAVFTAEELLKECFQELQTLGRVAGSKAIKSNPAR